MSQTRHILEARGLRFAYRPTQPVLRGVDFTASAGKLVCILGPNGSGKTTLLRCLLGWFRPAEGQVLLDGADVRRYRRKGLARMIAHVPQFPQSTFAFTAEELVLMGRFAHTGALGLAGQKDVDIARQAMIMTETDGFATRTLEELSGGEAQRVMIARALAQQPSVMLLDEPTSHLDIRNQLAIYRMMQRLAHDWNMAVVCVSHDVNVAARHADELVLMRDGGVIADGPSREVIREDILKEVYDVAVDLVDPGDGGVRLVLAREIASGPSTRRQSEG